MMTEFATTLVKVAWASPENAVIVGIDYGKGEIEVCYGKGRLHHIYHHLLYKWRKLKSFVGRA